MSRTYAAAVVLAFGCSRTSPPPTLDNPFDSDLPAIDAVTDVEVYVPPDAIPINPTDVSCGGVAVSLSRRNANVILVIDRSGSMALNTTDNVPRWRALNESLRTVLPTFSDNIALGLTFFPETVASRDGGALTPAEICTVPTALALEPRPRQADMVLDLFARTSPNGPTPTAAALRLVRDWYHRVPDLTGDRYVILATDGGPNCNLMADLTSCRCTGVGNCNPMTNYLAQINCLAAAPVISELQQLAHEDVHTFVIGLNGVQDFADVLNEMADAGGRARPGGPTDLYRFYSAATAVEITRQLEGISEVVSDCTLRVASPPPDPMLVDVRLDGRSFYHDVRRINGWDWGDESHNQIVFYGQTCTDVRNATGGSRLVAAFGCPAPVPP